MASRRTKFNNEVLFCKFCYIKGFVFHVNQIHRLRRIGLDCACRIINPTACNKKSVELSAPVGRLGLLARSTTQHSSSSSPRVRLCGVGCAFASCAPCTEIPARGCRSRVHTVTTPAHNLENRGQITLEPSCPKR